ncbi:hypothetical protein [Burkholderia ubonensis]|uniref:hypothetical protein n=1 Tax=Burkholderia ubonensis TaxID=101571 RepID=UPI0012FAA0EA|nr:hypothetical protein [Burkholderia ubonensis]
MTTPVAAEANNHKKEVGGKYLSGQAQSFNESAPNKSKKVTDKQIVSEFDTIAKNGGSIILSDSPGKASLEILVSSKLNIDVTQARDGGSATPIDTYKGLVNGNRAILVRSKDRLNVSWFEKKSNRNVIREFVKGGPEKIHRAEVLQQVENRDDVMIAPDLSLKKSRAARDTAKSAKDNVENFSVWSPPKPITFWVFVHQDTGTADGDYGYIYTNYFSWFIKHLTEDVLPGVPISVNFLFGVDGITDMAYYNAGGKDKVISEFHKKVYDYQRKRNISSGPRNAFLLFTEYNLESSWGGYAYIGDARVAIASDNYYINAAHELGHTMGLNHDDGDVTYYGWWCESIMNSDSGSAFRRPCYKFSEKSKKKIRKSYDWKPKPSWLD